MVDIIIIGKTKNEVQSKVDEMLENFETQKKFDYLLDMRKTEDGWKASLQFFFHHGTYNKK